MFIIVIVAVVLFHHSFAAITVQQGENVTISAKGSVSLKPGKGIVSLNGELRVDSNLFVQNQNLLSIIESQRTLIERLESRLELLEERLERYQFESSSNWHVFDASEALGVRGYTGAVFDGRYIYFSPYRNEIGAHGKVIRYDTQQTFFSSSSWSVFDATTVNSNAQGYLGAVHHGHYIYFAPFRGALNNPHGIVLRYDTQLSFTNANSWSTFNVQNLNGYDNSGFFGAITSNNFIYFVPRVNGIFLRYDTTLQFDDTNAWKSFNVSVIAGSSIHYAGGVYDNTKYIYFFPTTVGEVFAADKVVRYDTQQEFTSAAAWTAVIIGRQFTGGVLEGNYLYLAPYYNGTNYNGVAVRYDTRMPFDDGTGWSTYDAGSTGGLKVTGMIGAASDGRYIYYAPSVEPRTTVGNHQYHGRALRYDTRGSFTSESSWSVFDAGAALNARGYHCVIKAGQYLYFCPLLSAPNTFHGKILRYNTQVFTP